MERATVMRRCAVVAILGIGVVATAAFTLQSDVPALTGRVVDTAGLLSQETLRQVETMLAAHERQTSNQIAVLTVPSLGGEAVERYALRVAERWQLGTAELDNGILLLIARDDRELRIEVGYGLEGALTDAQAGRIIRNVITPEFRKGDFDSGVRNGVMAITGVLEGSFEPPADGNRRSEEPLIFRLIFAVMFLALPAFFAAIAVMSGGCMRWGLFLFLMPFMLVGGMALFGHALGGGGVWLLYVAAFVGSSIHVDRDPRWKERREKLKNGESVKVGFMTISPASFSSGSSSSGGWSSGGGFSGGGGSFGGGGASGRW